MRTCLLLLLPLFYAGCNGATAQEEDKADRDHARAVVAADFVFAEATPTPEDPAKTCTCNGTKIVKVQDGNNIRRVACPCGDNCKCAKKPGAAGAVLKIRYYGDPQTCPPCLQIDTLSFAILRQNGWDIGPEPDSLIEVITVPTNAPEAVRKKYDLQTVPTFEVVRVLPDGKEQRVRRETGFLSFVGIGELRDLKPISVKGRDKTLKWNGNQIASETPPSPMGDAAKEAAAVSGAAAKEPLLMGPLYLQLINGRTYHTTIEHLTGEDHPYHGRYTVEELTPYAHDQNALNRIHGYAHTGKVEAYTTQPINSQPRQFTRQR